jgi:hypothetical protein
MRSQRSVLTLKYTPISIAGGLRRAVGGFLRYVQYRDQHLEPEAGHALDAYVRYVAHRDRTSPAGRVFGKNGPLIDSDRRRFVDFVARSTRGLEPKWVTNKGGIRQDRQRAVYTFILSPEDWRGLDLRELARAAMRQLESDAGAAGIGPWFAAEHRNTAHHHVHIVLSARRELSPGRFSTVVVTRARLRRMKESIALEVARQRAREPRGPIDHEPRRLRAPRPEVGGVRRSRRARTQWRWLRASRSNPAVPLRTRHGQQRERALGMSLFQLRAVARHYHDQMERELERESARADREGWVL